MEEVAWSLECFLSFCILGCGSKTIHNGSPWDGITIMKPSIFLHVEKRIFAPRRSILLCRFSSSWDFPSNEIKIHEFHTMTTGRFLSFFLFSYFFHHFFYKIFQTKNRKHHTFHSVVFEITPFFFPTKLFYSFYLSPTDQQKIRSPCLSSLAIVSLFSEETTPLACILACTCKGKDSVWAPMWKGGFSTLPLRLDMRNTLFCSALSPPTLSDLTPLPQQSRIFWSPRVNGGGDGGWGRGREYRGFGNLWQGTPGCL